MEIPDKASSTPRNSTKLYVGSIREIPKPKIKTPAPGNSASLFFLGHPWKFHLINPWTFHAYAISLIPLEIPYPLNQPPLHVWFFSGIASWNSQNWYELCFYKTEIHLFYNWHAAKGLGWLTKLNLKSFCIWPPAPHKRISEILPLHSGVIVVLSNK